MKLHIDFSLIYGDSAYGHVEGNIEADRLPSVGEEMAFLGDGRFLPSHLANRIQPEYVRDMKRVSAGLRDDFNSRLRVTHVQDVDGRPLVALETVLLDSEKDVKDLHEWLSSNTTLNVWSYEEFR